MIDSTRRRLNASPPEPRVNITIHRGSHEVGGTCIELQSAGDRLILDVGLPLFDSHGHPLDLGFRPSQKELADRGLLPDAAGLFRGDDRDPPTAIVLSHAHIDHTGLLPFTKPDVLVYATKGTSQMMLAGSLFAGGPRVDQDRQRNLPPANPARIGCFRMTAYPVDHSVYGAAAILVETDEPDGSTQRLLYSGDLRLHGRKPGMARDLIEAIRRKGPIDTLLMEGTSLGFPDDAPKPQPSDRTILRAADEYELEDEITSRLSDHDGPALAHFSPQNVDRLVTFFKAAVRSGRQLVVDPYTAFVLHLLRGTGRYPLPTADGPVRLLLPNDYEQRLRYRPVRRHIAGYVGTAISRDELRLTPERFVTLFRPSMRSDLGTLLPGTLLFHSAYAGYLDGRDWRALEAELEEHNGQIMQAHIGGHIRRGDIASFVEAIGPKHVVPIHTFNRDDLFALTHRSSQ